MQMEWLCHGVQASPYSWPHILVLFLGKGHSQACGLQPYVFTKANRQPMKQAADMSNYWATMLEQMGCSAKFSPHM